MYDTTSPLVHAQVNLFADTYKPIPVRILTLAEALNEIRTGVYAAQIAYVRRMLARGEQSYRAAKNKLPAFTLAGTFAPSRLIANLQQHTGIIHADLDHLPDVLAVKQAISVDTRTTYTFVSPRGEGLKFGVRTPILPDDLAYKHAWQAVATEYERLYGGVWDPSGKDISRLCYVSYDPDIYVNFNADVFDVPPAPEPEPRPQPARPGVPLPHTNYQDYGARAISTAIEMIRSAQLGTRHHARLRAARLLGGYVASHLLSYEEALSALSRALEGHTEDMGKALKTVVDGLAYGEAYPISLEALENERCAWIESHRPTQPKTRQPPVEHDPWEGRRTLPLRPYQGLRLGKAARRG